MIIPGKLRPRSTYIAGNPGTGKSSLIQRMALHDIKQGRGVCVIDPKGDLVNRLIHHIPKSRVKDTIYFDSQNPIPIDFFSYNKNERQILTDQLVALFQLDNAPVAKPRLQKIFGTLFDANENGGAFTFLDVQRFIEKESFRDTVIKFCPHRKDDWSEMPPVKDFAPILERLTPFSETPALRKCFSSRGGLKIADVMHENKVLLVSLLDTSSDLLLGSLIAAKFQQATFGRRWIKESERTPYHLYIDEAHVILAYAVKEFEAILTRARSFKLCLTIANQIPGDLPAEIQRKFGMFGTLILFNIDPASVNLFKHHVAPFTAEHLVSLPDFQAIVRVGNAVQRIARTPNYLPFSEASYAEIIRKRSSTPDPSQDAANVVPLKDNGNIGPDDKEDDIEPSGPSNLPPYGDQTKGPRKPR